MKYDMLIDFDTPLVSAAAVQQTNSIEVTHTKSERSREFDNRTQFKEWLKDNPKWTTEDFTIEDKPYVVGSVNQAVEGLISQMHNIAEADCVRTVKFCVGGVHGNFRNDIARIQPYKGQRTEKPLLFTRIKKELLRRVPDMILQPQGAFETDDLLSMYMFEEKHLGTKSKRAISFIDKDLKTVVGWSNSFKTMEAPVYIDELAAFKNLAYQSLLGDSIDNIMGIPHQVDSVRERFSLRKGKGFGKVSAEKCLIGADTMEDIIERVVFVYQETFKDGYTLPDGTKLNWLEVLDENMQLLKMLDYEGQQFIFSKEFGIRY